MSCVSAITTRHSNASDVGIRNTYRDLHPLTPLYTCAHSDAFCAWPRDSDTIATRYSDAAATLVICARIF